MSDADLLSDAIILATSAHKGQLEKNGGPYVLHPLRLMLKATGTADQIVAVLHDVFEDTDLSLDMDSPVLDFPGVRPALTLLTHDSNTPYEEYVARIATNEIATRVKLLDLEDNSDTTRLATLEEKDLQRLAKYHRARKFLTEAQQVRSNP